jgi:uncharacterized protein (UPF0333 family)
LWKAQANMELVFIVCNKKITTNSSSKLKILS